MDEKKVLPIYLIPIPGKNGNETDTVTGGIVFAQFHIENKNNSWETGDIVHETCHYFMLPSRRVSKQMLGWINPTENPSSKFLYDIINEVLATSIGDGYAHRIVQKSLNPGVWYNNVEYDTMAKALLPEVTDYLDHHRPIDQAFIETAKKLLAEKFPRFEFSYRRILGSELMLYEQAGIPYPDFKNFIKKTFKIRSMSARPSTDLDTWEKEYTLGYPENHPNETFRSIVFITTPKHQNEMLKIIEKNLMIVKCFQN